jgi:hypothetical protein
MKEKKAKLKLEDIRVESFITSMDEIKVNGIEGKSGDANCDNTGSGCYSVLNTWCNTACSCYNTQCCSNPGTCVLAC